MKRLLVTASIVALLATGGQAATYPTFVLDTAASDIDITLSQNCSFFGCSSIVLDAEFAAGADNFSWTPTSPNDSVFEGDFIDWTVGGLGSASFDVEVTLAFSSPDAASGSTDGDGWVATFFGLVSGGVLSWDGPASVSFAQGSTLDIYLDGTHEFGFGGSTTTGAWIVGNDIAAVPLPAGGLLLIGALGGLGALRRRKKAA